MTDEQQAKITELALAGELLFCRNSGVSCTLSDSGWRCGRRFTSWANLPLNHMIGKADTYKEAMFCPACMVKTYSRINRPELKEFAEQIAKAQAWMND